MTQKSTEDTLSTPGGFLDDFYSRFDFERYAPPTDVSETQDMVIIRAEVPGVPPADLSLSIRDSTITFEGRKRERMQSLAEVNRCHLKECSYGLFQHSVEIHCAVDFPSTRAVLENGVLSIFIPKRTDRRGQVLRIEIQTNKE